MRIKRWELTKALPLTIVLGNCKGVDEEEYAGAAARERDHRLRDRFGREPGECGFGTGMQKKVSRMVLRKRQ